MNLNSNDIEGKTCDSKFVKGTAGDLKKTKQTRDSAPQEEEVYEPEKHEEVVEEETSKDGNKKYNTFVGKLQMI